MASKDRHSLYFIIRSYMMSVIGGVIFPAIVFILGSINFVQTIFIGFFVFVSSLAISRIFEKHIDEATKKILKYLDRHKNVKKFILKYF